MRNRASKIILLCGLLIVNIQLAFGQDQAKIEALNTYVQFLNESVHGLFTAHALMVISNKEVNRYIDLDSYILNNISNDEVQSNLFAKSDKANYTTFHTYSPLELKEISKQKSKALNPVTARKLNKQVEDIVVILNKVNQIRIDIDDFIQSHDLNEKESIYGVFEILEEGVKLFAAYSKAHARLAKDIQSLSPTPTDELVKKAEPVHSYTQTILRNLRLENDTYVNENISGLKEAFEDLNEEAKVFGVYNKTEYKNNIKVKLDNIVKLMDGYINSGYVPIEHELYGKHYYYHNEMAKRYFNWSGPGFVRNLNKLLTTAKLDFVHFVEEPLIFKVVYPMKLDELNKITKEQDQVEKKIPQAPDGSSLKFSSPKERFDNPPGKNYVVIEVFDFNMFDRDSISVNYNGDWILEDHMLTFDSEKLKIVIDDNDDPNDLTFRAENIGLRAPNTFAVAYRFNGERKRYLRKYNLYEGQTLKVDLNNFK